MKQFFAPSILIYFLAACSGTEQAAPATTVEAKTDSVETVNTVQTQQAWQEKPFEDIDIEFKEYNYNPKKGLRFELPSGTLVDIPKQAFEDENGNAVAENVTVKYREFHTINDIMLSGIKMKYNEGDTTDGDFETAGMFEIRAFKGDEELNLRKDKTIDVELASYKDGDFSSYKMNEETNNWEFIENTAPAANLRKKEKIEQINELDAAIKSICKPEPLEYTAEMELIDLDYDFDYFRHATFINEAMWISAGGKKEKEELKKSLTGHNEMEIIPTDSCNVFELTVWKREIPDKKKMFRLFPVWSGKAYERVRENYQEHLDEMKRIMEERKMAEREADLVRKFELRGMGVYNCDRIIDYAKFVIVSLAVLFKDEIKSFFYITNNRQVAIKYYNPTVSSFRFNPESSNSIVAILPGNKVGIVTEKAFADAWKKLEADPAKDKKLEVEMVTDDVPAADKKDFDQHVARY